MASKFASSAEEERNQQSVKAQNVNQGTVRNGHVDSKTYFQKTLRFFNEQTFGPAVLNVNRVLHKDYG